MEKITFIGRVNHKIDEKTRPLLAGIRRKKLTNTDFSIISNNCWGGICSEYFGLQKNSPTVGMYFFAEDYIKFLSDLKRYTSMDIRMISASQSKHVNELRRRGQMNIPVGVIDDDIEVVFLHYKNPEIAKSKWMKRKERINWDNLIIKFSYMNKCNDSMIYEFENIVSKLKAKSFVFVGKDFEYKNAIKIPALKDGQIENDTFYWNKYIDVVKLINS